MPLNFEKLHPLFVAEVTGVDLRQTIDDETLSEIQEAFDTHSILIFRDQDISDTQQIAFSQRLGPLERMLKGSMGDGTPIANLSNVDPETGAVMAPKDKRVVRNSANMLWHTDSSFKRVPALASLLSGREVPPEGGETEFASTRAAFADLPDDRKQGLDALIVEHSFAYSRGKVDPTMLNQEQRDEVPPVPHPLIRDNPVNGQRALYVGSHASHIFGRPVEEGRALLEELLGWATQPKFCYLHKWRPKDLVMWDNRCVLHRGRPWDYKHRRVMRRTTVAGDGPTVSDADWSRLAKSA
ncbi:MAG: TauD/TfdA family dioxygenase [Alphaproteobacteria bacterium]|nr:TauD/TfdA family dioxygenase [Alphaproteobacteria bacterium]